MKKREFLRTIVKKATLGVNEAQVEEVLAIAKDLFLSNLRKDGKSTYPELIIAEVKERKARNGVNPKTGEKIQIPAKKVVKVKGTKAVKDAIDA